MRKVAFQNVAFLILLVSVVTGCRIDPNAEREIALLRSEILDLEDQYYTLRSRSVSYTHLTLPTIYSV